MSKRENRTFNYDADHFDNEIFLALFRKGADEYLEKDLIDRTDLEKESQFSEDADTKIKNMIKQAIRKEKSKSTKRAIPKIFAFSSAVVIIFLVTVISVEAFRAPFLNFLIHTEEKITDIDINSQQATMEGESFEDTFSYIPKGFELVSEEIQRNDASLLYTNEAGERIVIDIHSDESYSGVDTEGSQYKEIIIKDEPAFYSSKNGFTNLVLPKQEYAYMITSTIKLPEIIKIAENIK